MPKNIWIARDNSSCTGCRRCELACSMFHEGWMWPEASRVRVFMPFPGLEVPHLCSQCKDYPCIASCPVDALSKDSETEAVIVDREKCISCGNCIRACPGTVPYLHPGDNKATICNLCNGDPECVKVCTEAGYNALTLVNEKTSVNRKLYSRNPVEIAKDLAVKFFGEKGEEVIE
jgi:Fe-S-cluster-containing hydrogenase component 2